MTPNIVSDDLLYGATEIAEFLGTNTREVYHLAKTKRLPIGRLGRKLVASRCTLANHIEKITGGSSMAKAAEVPA